MKVKKIISFALTAAILSGASGVTAFAGEDIFAEAAFDDACAGVTDCDRFEESGESETFSDEETVFEETAFEEDSFSTTFEDPALYSGAVNSGVHGA